MKIYANTGLSIKEFSEIAQKSNVTIVKTRVAELVQMYENHPEKLAKLIKEIVKDG